MNFRDPIVPASDQSKYYDVQLHDGVLDLFDDEAKSVLKENGIIVSKISDGKVSLHALSDATSLKEAFQRISPLSIQGVFSAMAKAPDEVIEAIEYVNRLNLLKSKFQSPDPRFPFGGMEGFPYSSSMDEEIEQRFDYLLARLKSHGITMKVGVELEFVLTPEPLNGFGSRLDAFMAQVKEDEIEKSKTNNDIEKSAHIRRLQGIAKFTERDFFMLYLYEYDDVIPKVFEHKFGAEGGGIGYYDNDHVFEMTTPPVEAEDFFPSYLDAQRHLLGKCLEFGFKTQGRIMQQLNMSFWHDGRNILLAETPEDEELSAVIIQAMGRMLENGHELILPNQVIQADRDCPIISPSRLSLARHSHGRIELKGFANEAQHLILGATLGAASAYSTQTPEVHSKVKKNAASLRAVTTCGTRATDSEIPWLRHALNASHIDLNTGEVEPDERYIRMSATKILHQINPADPAFRSEVMTPDGSLPYSEDHHFEAVMTLVSMAKVSKDEKGKYQIRWPEGYVIGISRDTQIDLDALNEHIECTGVSTRYIYEATADEDWQTRVGKANENEVVNLALGSTLTEKLVALRIEDVQAQDPEYLLREFIMGMAEAFKSKNSKDDGQGHAVLSVEVNERSTESAQKGIKSLLKMVRKDGSGYGSLFNAISVIGALCNQETGNVNAFLVKVPTVRYDDIKRAFIQIADSMEQSETKRPKAREAKL